MDVHRCSHTHSHIDDWEKKQVDGTMLIAVLHIRSYRPKRETKFLLLCFSSELSHKKGEFQSERK